MNVLLSVKPFYANAILKGTKKYEFRRTIFKEKGIENIYIYCNSTTKKIIGSFKIDKIFEAAPLQLWAKFNKYGGIDKADFFKYFMGCKKSYCIKIKDVKKFRNPIDPYSYDKNFVAPQSFYYISDKKLLDMKNAKSK